MEGWWGWTRDGFCRLKPWILKRVFMEGNVPLYFESDDLVQIFTHSVTGRETGVGYMDSEVWSWEGEPSGLGVPTHWESEGQWCLSSSGGPKKEVACLRDGQLKLHQSVGTGLAMQFAGPSTKAKPLVQKLFRISRWRQRGTKLSTGSSKCGALCGHREASGAGRHHFSLFQKQLSQLLCKASLFPLLDPVPSSPLCSCSGSTVFVPSCF